MAGALAYPLALAARARAALARALLTAPPERERLVELTRSGSRLVRGFDDERRRIERDLHDGVQQRLLTLSVTLGLARLELSGDGTGLASAWGGGPGGDAGGRGAAARVAEAHEESKAILDQLRALVRGIHPRILTDRGLPAALDELAARSAVPVDTDVELPGRFPDVVESTVYFVASEALSNVDKHSGARRARILCRYGGGTLSMEVRDDGRGGVDPDGGTGLRGLADRSAAAGARLLLSSPPGGPTVLRLEVPCTPGG